MTAIVVGSQSTDRPTVHKIRAFFFCYCLVSLGNVIIARKYFARDGNGNADPKL